MACGGLRMAVPNADRGLLQAQLGSEIRDFPRAKHDILLTTGFCLPI